LQGISHGFSISKRRLLIRYCRFLISYRRILISIGAPSSGVGVPLPNKIKLDHTHLDEDAGIARLEEIVTAMSGIGTSSFRVWKSIQ
jgi:hypothetical protein